MVFFLSRVSICWRFANLSTRQHSAKQRIVLFRHLIKAGMGDTVQSVEKIKPRIFITRPDFPKNGIDLLQKKFDIEIFSKEKTVITKEEIIQGIKDKSALFCSLNERIDKDILKSAGPSLKVVSTMSVGVEHIDINECKKLGIRVGYTPYVLTEATAELTIALLLATSRRIFEAHHHLRTGGWSSWQPVWMCGPALKGSTVGLVGFGRIGQEVARKLKAFHVGKILYTDSGKAPTTQKTDVVKELGAERAELDPLLAASDFVIVTCTLTPKTELMFNAERFSRMKPTAIFINTGRGGVVDHDALDTALKEGKIWAAGLDVMTPEPLPTDHPLLKLTNCVLLPHIGSATYQSRMAMCELAARNVINALEQLPMPAEYV